jgi:hypothetical protein
MTRCHHASGLTAAAAAAAVAAPAAVAAAAAAVNCWPNHWNSHLPLPVAAAATDRPGPVL